MFGHFPVAFLAVSICSLPPLVVLAQLIWTNQLSPSPSIWEWSCKLLVCNKIIRGLKWGIPFSSIIFCRFYFPYLLLWKIVGVNTSLIKGLSSVHFESFFFENFAPDKLGQNNHNDGSRISQTRNSVTYQVTSKIENEESVFSEISHPTSKIIFAKISACP